MTRPRLGYPRSSSPSTRKETSRSGWICRTSGPNSPPPCPRRLAYPNASFALAEPKLEFRGTVTPVTERQQQAERMLDSLYYRIAEATGREADQIREDARRGRTLTTAEAIGYGLIHDRVEPRA